MELPEGAKGGWGGKTPAIRTPYSVAKSRPNKQYVNDQG